MLINEVYNRCYSYNNLKIPSIQKTTDIQKFLLDISDISESISHVKSQVLHERFGVFDYDEKYYFKLFKDIVISSINALSYKHLPNDYHYVNLIKNSNSIFYKTELTDLIYNHNQLFKNLSELKIYISINSENSTEVYAYVNNDNVDYYNNHELPLYQNKNGKYICSIIIEINKNDYDEYTVETIAGLIMHEFMHIMHAIVSNDTSEYTQDANGAAILLMNNIGYNEMPSLKHLQIIYKHINDNKEFQDITLIKMFIACCMYYCDMSERAAYLQNIRADIDQYKDKIKTFNNYNDFIKFFKQKSNIFQLYFMMYSIFLKFENQNIKITNSIKSETNQFIKNIFFDHKSLEYNGHQYGMYYNIRKQMKDISHHSGINNLSDMCYMWKSSIKKQCKNIDRILKDYFNYYENK